MEIRELRYILAIAKHQNLTKAAEELFISQSTLTKFLHKYEEENNLTLFIKVGNRFILSENGKVFVKKADEILRIHDLFVRELGTLKNEVSGCLSISFPTTRSIIMLSNILSQFHNIYPGIHIQVSDVPVEHVRNEIKGGNIDLAFISVPFPELDLPVEILGHEEIFFIASSNNRIVQNVLEKNLPLDLKMFKNEPFIMPVIQQKLYATSHLILSSHDIIPNEIMHCKNHTVRINLVKMDFGITPIFSTMLDGRDIDSKITLLNSKSDKLDSAFAVAYYDKRYLPQYALYFIELVKNAVQQPFIYNNSCDLTENNF